jgi:TetR/AcrR family acrAB operon transcriptional repressor
MARKTKEQALETREGILDAAEQLFQRKGVSRTSLADIAAAAGVTRGAIYWHFENKGALFNAMVERVVAPLEARSLELEQTEMGEPLEFLRTLLLDAIMRIAGDAHFQRVFEIVWHKCEYVDEMAAARDKHMEAGCRHVETMERAMVKAQERGQLPPKLLPKQAAIGLMALLDGLIVNWTMNPQMFPLADYAPWVIDAYLEGLKQDC